MHRDALFVGCQTARHLDLWQPDERRLVLLLERREASGLESLRETLLRPPAPTSSVLTMSAQPEQSASLWVLRPRRQALSSRRARLISMTKHLPTCSHCGQPIISVNVSTGTCWARTFPR